MIVDYMIQQPPQYSLAFTSLSESSRTLGGSANHDDGGEI
jgi:hypothetical protein